MKKPPLSKLIHEAQSCRYCESFLPEGPRPVFSISKESRIIIIGQAPGKKVHLSGIPWDDPSGDNLRKWMGIDKSTFYNNQKIAILPMGFCYPGKGKSGDLPPRPECAPLWHGKMLAHMTSVTLTLLIGQYAQKHYLGNEAKRTLTETVAQFEGYMPGFSPLPHPSPRNNIWQKKHPWFRNEVLPELRRLVNMTLNP